MTTIPALCLIPARGGSRGLPGKNLLRLCGRSLVARAVDCARAAVDGRDALVIVSTDDERIAAEAQEAGAVVRHRPAELATDAAPMAPVIDDALEHMAVPPAAHVLLLQPTSPLRTPASVRDALGLLDAGALAVVSVCLAHHGSRGPILGADWAPARTERMPRQQRAQQWRETGSIYGWTQQTWRAHREILPPVPLAALRLGRVESVDVDEEDDVRAAEAALHALGVPLAAAGDAVELTERFIAGESVGALGAGAEAALRYEARERREIISHAFALLQALGDGLSDAVAREMAPAASSTEHAAAYRMGVAHGRAQAETALGHLTNALYGRVMRR